MDPATFTQKLLERTQARKEALRLKNEEFNASRNKRNTPSKPPRRPLSEDNSEGGLPSAPSPAKPPRRPFSEDSDTGGITDDASRRRIASDSSVSHTPTKVTVTARVPITPRGSATKVPPSTKVPQRPFSEDNEKGGMPDDGYRRRIASDSSVSKTPTKVTVTARVPTTPRGSTTKAPYSDRAPTTPTSVSQVRAELNMDSASSPSIKARKQQLIMMQQKDQESAVTPKKHWKKALDVNPTENKSPSVAARSAIFQSNKEKAPFPTVTTATPGKVSTRKDLFEKNSQQDTAETKSSSSAPQKPPRMTENERTLHREKSSSKRKAPPPPAEATESPVCKPRNKEVVCDYSVVSASSEEVPSKRERKTEKDTAPRKPVRTTVDVVMEAVPKPRKRTQLDENKVDSVDKKKDDNSIKELEERAKRREERKKARMESNAKEDVVVATAQAVEECQSTRSSRNPTQRVEAVLVAEVSSPKRAAPRQRTRVEVVTDSVNEKQKIDKKDRSDNYKIAERKPEMNFTRDPKTASEQDKPAMDKNSASSKTVENKQEFVHMMTHGSNTHLRSTDNLHRYGSLGEMHAGMDDALNETVNLNDVNIHEMTFTFDFSNFDKIQEDRETKFQKSFNETQQQLEKEKNNEARSTEIEKVKMIASQPKPTPTMDEKNNGVFKSGYSMDTDDKYATKVYKKEKPPVPERPKPTQERIKEFLDQAASHQNIILQTSQALNVCESNNEIFKGSQEEIEAERVLLLASERKQACLNEHHRLKSGRKESTRGHYVDPKACSSTVSLSGIRLAIKQEFMDVLRVGIRHDLGVFHFVCHVQHGPLEITTTKALSIHDCIGDGGNYLIFPDKFVMKDLNPDFNIVVRVFGMHVQKHNPHAVNASQKHKLFQSPKTPKNKRVPDGTSPRGGAEAMPVFRTSNFKLVGSARITLANVNSKKWSLEGLIEGCPLKETINMKINCMPHYTSCVKGFLTILEDVGGFSAWQRRWCVLEGGILSYWRYPGDEADKAPMGTLDIGQCISERITTVPRDLCARPNTIEVAMKKDKDEDYKFLLACDTKEDRITWLDCLNDALTDMKAWNSKKNKKAIYPEISQEEKVHMC